MLKYGQKLLNKIQTEVQKLKKVGTVYDSKKFWDKSYKLELNFINTKLDFYSGDKLIRNCEDYMEEEKQHLRYSLFEALAKTSVHFLKTTYKTPICTLAFNKANISEISWYSLTDTFMKTNLPKFKYYLRTIRN